MQVSTFAFPSRKDWTPARYISLRCGMRKPSKVVCITEKRRNVEAEPRRSKSIEREAIGTLHWERGSNRIDFFLSPLFGNRQREANNTDSRTPELTILPPPSNEPGE
jgi:hypothetical protein